MTCKHFGTIHAQGSHPDVFFCKGGHGICTLVPTEMKKHDGTPVQMCSGDCDFFQLPRPKYNFCYVMGSTRPQDTAMISASIRSARASGVLEDFLSFAVSDAEDARNFRISPTLNWDNHMAKIALVSRSLRENDYDAAVWLDSDSWFVRDPGDLRSKLRDNPVWISMEGALTDYRASERHGDWWTMWAVGKGKPDFVEIMRGQGCQGKTIYSTNGGCWIVRKDAVDEFEARINAVSNSMRINNPKISDEPPLAVIGQTMVTDFELNKIEADPGFWASDWAGRFKEKLPDGSPWLYQDWMTGRTWVTNPAIVHVMRSKHLMTRWPGHATASPQRANAVVSREPVGTKLREVLAECGIVTTAQCPCREMQGKMDAWGIDGCLERRSEIINHLDQAAKEARWLQWGKVALKGYLSSRSLLMESLRRAEKT